MHATEVIKNLVKTVTTMTNATSGPIIVIFMLTAQIPKVRVSAGFVKQESLVKYEQVETFSQSGFRCECKLGYEGDGIQCYNINECFQNSHNCHSDGKCRDTDGSYECECNHGYDGSGNGPAGCADIDECDATYVTSASMTGTDSADKCIGYFQN